MGDQPAVAVDDIGIAGLPDLDRGDHVPDQLEVDLGHRDPGAPAGARQRHRHVGLGFLAEVDRAEPDALVLDLLEARLVRAVGARLPTTSMARRETLSCSRPCAVELRQLGDRRHLAQQPDEVEAALVDRSRRPLRVRRPADLPLDLVDELLDALSAAAGLLVLQAGQRVLRVP